MDSARDPRAHRLHGINRASHGIKTAKGKSVMEGFASGAIRVITCRAAQAVFFSQRPCCCFWRAAAAEMHRGPRRPTP